MSFLKPKISIPPPPPPPPPPPAVTTPASVVRPDKAVEAVKEEAKKKKASVKTSVVTGPQGLLQEAPVEKASLLGSAAKK